MLPDRVSNPGPLTYESGALPIALRGPSRIELRGIVLPVQVGGLLGGGQRVCCPPPPGPPPPSSYAYEEAGAAEP